MTDVYDVIEGEEQAVDYDKEWKTSDIGPDRLAKCHSYTVGDLDSTPTFPRFEKFMALEPARDIVFEGPLPEFVGYDDDGNVISKNAMPELTEANRHRINAPLSPRRPKRDKWKEWSRARARLLLGGATSRRAKKASSRGTNWFTAFPEDELVNVAIVTQAMKFFPWSYQEDALPSEEARDLMAHLALDGVRRNKDGSFDVRFLRQEAKAYIKNMRGVPSVNKYRYMELNNTNKGLKDD